MTTKTITVTENAYYALKAMKNNKESFSETIVRVSGKKPLNYFFGCLSKKSGEELERVIIENRKNRNKSHEKRMKHIIENFGGA